MTRKCLLAVAAAGLTLLPGLALAADASATAVDVGPLLNQLAVGAIGIVTALGGALLVTVQRVVAKRAKVNLDISQGSILRSATDNAVHLAVSQIQAFIGKPGVGVVDVHSVFAAQVIAYLQQHIPDVLTYFGKSPADLTSMALSALARLYPDVATAMKTATPAQVVPVPPVASASASASPAPAA